MFTVCKKSCFAGSFCLKGITWYVIAQTLHSVIIEYPSRSKITWAWLELEAQQAAGRAFVLDSTQLLTEYVEVESGKKNQRS